MADLTQDALVARNYQKTQATTTLGTRNLAFFQIDMRTNVATDYEMPNSLYSQAVRALQQRIELYGIGLPENDWFTVIASADTAPFPADRMVGDGYRNSILEDIINEVTGRGDVRVWDGLLRGSAIENDC